MALAVGTMIRMTFGIFRVFAMNLFLVFFPVGLCVFSAISFVCFPCVFLFVDLLVFVRFGLVVAGGGLSSPSGGEGVGPGLALNLFSGLAAAVAAIALVKFAKETLATEQGEEQRRRGLALESERADRPCSAVADGSSHTTLKRENNDGEKTKQKKPTQAAGQDASPPESSLLAS
eukprot:GHVT01045359.1.p2 GENE.GHVT01045359.1~~GHVT01045359.1.p2  ORF type:complete len:175 (+),score=46.04 GHVT01045359.1:2837-3361(+)